MIHTVIQGISLELHTEPSVFSPQRVDAGTLAMLSCVQFNADDKVLDLGCGYGVVGIYAAKIIGDAHVVMLDNDETAISIARENAEFNGVPGIATIISDGFRGLDDTGFTKILANPPYHTDFAIAKHFIEKGFNRLVIGGQFYMVTKRKDWYHNKLAAIFGGVKIHEIDGYYVFMAEKRGMHYAKKSKG